MKAVIYARVSSVCSDRQDTERQVVDLKKYARSNNIEVLTPSRIIKVEPSLMQNVGC